MTHVMQTNKSSYVEKRRHGVSSVPRGLRPSFPRHSCYTDFLSSGMHVECRIRRQHKQLLDSLTLPENNPFSLSTSSFGSRTGWQTLTTQTVAGFSVLFLLLLKATEYPFSVRLEILRPTHQRPFPQSATHHT